MKTFHVTVSRSGIEIGDYVHGIGISGRVIGFDTHGVKVRRLNWWERLIRWLRSSK